MYYASSHIETVYIEYVSFSCINTLCASMIFTHLHSEQVLKLKIKLFTFVMHSSTYLFFVFFPKAHVVTSESSRKITAARRLQLGIPGCWDGPAAQQGTSRLLIFQRGFGSLIAFASHLLSVCFCRARQQRGSRV